jgi:hypothetical protein
VPQLSAHTLPVSAVATLKSCTKGAVMAMRVNKLASPSSLHTPRWPCLSQPPQKSELRELRDLEGV